MVREPQQERSRATLEHILDAAEAILRVRTFDNASIQAICARAGVTTGAFYARFEGKSALLTAILERQQKLMTERITALREAAALARYSELAQRIGLLVRTSIDFYRSQKGTLLPLRTQALDDERLKAQIDRGNKQAKAALIDFLLESDPRSPHPHPQQATSLALLVLFSTLRTALVDADPWLDDPPVSDEMLASELTRAMSSICGLPSEARRAKA